MLCAEHTTYQPGCDACARADRLSSLYGHASADVQEATKVLARGVSPLGADKLENAVASLNAYLAELKR
jgi:hypothetical protein